MTGKLKQTGHSGTSKDICACFECGNIKTENIIKSISRVSTRKRSEEGGWSLVLCPLDALQVDAFLHHLPQRTGKKKRFIGIRHNLMVMLYLWLFGALQHSVMK